MSEVTNTPNGDSKDLYSQNRDKGMVCNYYGFIEQDPEIEQNNDEAVAGSNTILAVNPETILSMTFDQIAKYGCVVMPLVILKEKYKEFKEAKMKASEKLQAEMEAKEDKNNNGIDDNLEK